MPNNLTNQIIYANGRYRVVPLVTLLQVQVGGRALQTFGVDEIEDAVATVDRLAEGDGVFCHASMGD
jgi:hypothetical protein